MHEPNAPHSAEASAPDLDPLRLVQRWKYAFAATCVTVVVLVGILTVFATPIYETRIKILISDEQSQQVDPTRVNQPIDKEFCQTQAEILKSRPIAEAVVKRLSLDTRVSPKGPVDYLMSGLTRVREMLSRDAAGSGDAALAEHFKLQESVSNLQDRIGVYLVRNATVLDVTVADWDRQMVQKTADALGEIFVERTRELKRDDSHQANIYLTERLAETSRKLIQAENELRVFEEKFQAAHLDMQIKHLIESRKMTVDDELSTVEKLLAEERARIDQVSAQLQAQYRKLVTGQGQGVIAQLKMQQMEKQAALSTLQVSYTADHPEVAKLRMEIESIERSLAKEQTEAHSGQVQAADRVTENLEVTANGAQQSLKVLLSRRETLVKQKAELSVRITELLSRSAQHALLSREVEANKKLYEVILMRQKEAALKEATISAPARMIERPIIPRRPARPRKTLNLALGLMFGVLCGLVMVHLLEYLDTTLKTRAEIAAVVGVPVLGTLSRKGSLRIPDGDLERAVQSSPMSAVAESFKTLRASLRHAVPAETHGVLLVTSAQASEGKTTVVANLAITMANGGERVLMIDADLRRPRLDRVFEMPGKAGIGDIGTVPLDDLIHATSQPNLWIVPAGTSVKDPAMHLESPAVRDALRALRGRFDRILIDTPPVNVVSDSVGVVPLADGILFVVCAEEVTRSSLETAMERLRNVRAAVVGLVINNLRSAESSSYGYYYYSGEDRRRTDRRAGTPPPSPDLHG